MSGLSIKIAGAVLLAAAAFSLLWHPPKSERDYQYYASQAPYVSDYDKDFYRSSAAIAQSVDGINAAEFMSLRLGMTYTEAVEIIGAEGQLLSENNIGGVYTAMYVWMGEAGNGANANAMFQNGKLIQKAQFGL